MTFYNLKVNNVLRKISIVKKYLPGASKKCIIATDGFKENSIFVILVPEQGSRNWCKIFEGQSSRKCFTIVLLGYMSPKARNKGCAGRYLTIRR